MILEVDCLILVKNLCKVSYTLIGVHGAMEEALRLSLPFEGWEIRFYRRPQKWIADQLAKIAYYVLKFFRVASL